MLQAALRRQLAAAWPGLIQAVQAQWYLTAGLCLILTSAGLRFHGLTEHGLRYDEWWVSHFTDGSLAELVSGLREEYKAPALYPLALWVIQKIDVSLFSIRFLPALAGVLTTASLLFLLPRAGLNRRAAFLAALAATVCAQLVWHSQDAREYSIDALMTTLMVAGLLWYLRGNSKLPLCLSLFFAVHLQFGLALLGAAALIAASVHRRPAANGAPRRAWFRAAAGHPLVWPAVCFLAGGALSYAINPVELGGGVETQGFTYLKREFFGSDYSASSITGFVVRQTWLTLNYFMTAAVTIGVLGGLALFLVFRGAGWVASRRRSATGDWSRNQAPAPAGDGTALANRADVERRSGQAVITLFLLSITIGAAAAVLNLYPFGYTRQSIYLGPVVFLAAGVLIHSAIKYASGRFPRIDWASSALFLLASGLLLGLGATDLQQRERQYGHNRTTSYAVIVPFLQENVLAEDVFVTYDHMFWMLDWYSAELTDSYHQGPSCLDQAEHPPTAELMRCIRYAASIGADLPNRLWFVSGHHFPAPREFAKWSEQTLVQPVITQLTGPQLHLITNLAAGWLERYEAITAGEPVARSVFEVYLDGGELHYAKEPCAPSDTADTFLLHLVPADVGDLPEWRTGYDTDNLDFQFDETYFEREVYAARFDGKCLASVPLPDYPIVEIRTGQLRPDGSALWRVDLAPNPELVHQVSEKRLLDYQLDYRAVVSGPPAARAVFAMYLDGQTLHYAKEPCAPADTEATFLLHLIPQDADDLPEEGSSRFYGFENRDFTFTDHGAEFGSACLASVPLPDYPLAVIRTGQYRPDGQRLWMAEFPAGR